MKENEGTTAEELAEDVKTEGQKGAQAPAQAPDKPQPAAKKKAPSKEDKAKADQAKAERAKADAMAREKEKQAKADAVYAEIAERYAEHHPSCSAFHITSDKMVFLEANLNEATEHQATLERGKVRTIKVR